MSLKSVFKIKKESPVRELRDKAFCWSALRGSNPQPSESESDTLSG